MVFSCVLAHQTSAVNAVHGLPKWRETLHVAFATLQGVSDALQHTLAAAGQIAPTGNPVLIRGAAGTGKTELARGIHEASGRTGPFVPVDSATFDANSLPRKLELATGGTLLLRNIGALGADVQAAVLQAMADGTQGGAVRSRVIATSRVPLEIAVDDGRFSADLYDQFSAVIDIAPLADRPQDIAPIARTLLARDGRADWWLHPDALAMMERHTWPGNVPELDSLLRRTAMTTGASAGIRVSDLRSAGLDIPVPEATAAEPTPEELGVEELLRRVTGVDRDDRARWAEFFIVMAEDLGRTTFSRRDVLALLARTWPDRSRSSHVHTWEEGMRDAFVGSGMLEDTGKRLSINVAVCRQTRGARRRARPSSIIVPGDLAATAGGPETEIIGRSREIADIRERLRSHPLITLTGPGGIGKTSLARATLRASAADYPGGSWFVDLTNAVTDADVLAQVASVLGVSIGSTEAGTEAIGRVLKERDGATLVVLDNFEQVVTVAASHVAEWRAAAPATRMLLTSRVPLKVADEKVIDVQPLGLSGVPDDASDAVQLLRHLATRARPGHNFDADLPVLANIAKMLDGLPLALELAAARMRVLTPRQLADRMEQAMSLLRSTDRDRPDRQRTIAAAFQWSYDALEEPDRAAFVGLSAFRGGFDIEAAEAVLEPLPDGHLALDAVQTLVESSLIHPVDRGIDARFNMYFVIREFALAQRKELDPDDDAGLRHATYFARRAAAWFDEHLLDETRRDDVEAAVVTERDNLAEARTQLLARGMVEEAGQVTLALASVAPAVGDISHRPEQLAEVLNATPPPSEWLRFCLIAAQAREMVRGSAAPMTISAFDDMIAELREAARKQPATGPNSRRYRLLLATVLYVRAGIALARGDTSHSLDGGDQSIDLLRKLGDDRRLCLALSMRARVRRYRGMIDGAAEDSRTCAAIAATRGYDSEEAEGLWELGLAQLQAGQAHEAREAMLRARAAADKTGNAATIASLAYFAASVSTDAGEFAEAREWAAQAVTQSRLSGRVDLIGLSLIMTGRVTRWQGDITGALGYYARGAEVCQTLCPEVSYAANISRAEMLLELDRPAEADVLLTPLVDTVSGSARRFALLVALARARHAIGRDAAALIEEASGLVSHMTAYRGLQRREIEIALRALEQMRTATG